MTPVCRHERHQHVDTVGRLDLRLDLQTDAGLSWCVGQQGGVEKRNQRRRNLFRSPIRKYCRDGAQDLACGGGTGAADVCLRQHSRDGVDELPSKFDPDLCPIFVWHVGQCALDCACQMERYAVGRFGGPQVLADRHDAAGQIPQLRVEFFGDQLLEQAGPVR
jgi:hypothetical protein